MLLTKDPAGAGMQAMALGRSEDLPAGQRVATVAPMVLTNDPAGAGTHAVAFGTFE